MSELFDAVQKKEWEKMMVRRLLEVVWYPKRIYGSESMLQILNHYGTLCQGPSLAEFTAHPVVPLPMVQ